MDPTPKHVEETHQKASNLRSFRVPPQAPLLFTHSPESMLQSVGDLINRLRPIYDNILKVQRDSATFENVLKPIAIVESGIAVQKGILNVYCELSPNPDLREGAQTALDVLWSFELDAERNKRIFQLISAIENKMTEDADADAESLRFLKMVQGDMVQKGLALPSEDQGQYQEVRVQIRNLEIEILSNLQNAKTGVWLFPHELDDHSEGDIAKLQQGTNENKGKVYYEINRRNQIGYMKNSDARKRILLARENMCRENVPLFKELLIARDQKARLLGYSSYAALVLEQRMANNVETVKSFLEELKSQLIVVEKQKVTDLTDLKRKDLENREQQFDNCFWIWDSLYYQHFLEITKKTKPKYYIEEYFSLETTIQGLIEILETLFNISFLEIKEEEAKLLGSSGQKRDLFWHEDIRAFAVWDRVSGSDSFLGYLYLDLLHRDNKASKIHTFTIQPVS
jgi:metallopeptidase MepB